jgi:hypothetical protein
VSAASWYPQLCGRELEDIKPVQIGLPLSGDSEMTSSFRIAVAEATDNNMNAIRASSGKPVSAATPTAVMAVRGAHLRRK